MRDTLLVTEAFLALLAAACSPTPATGNTLATQALPTTPIPTSITSLSPGLATLVAGWETQGPIPSSTPRPLASSTGTSAPSTPTSIPLIPKPAVVIYEVGLGDGGISFYDFMQNAYTEPDLIIYADGQVIARQGDWFGQRQASPSEICGLIRDFRAALRAPGERYLDVPLPEFGFGNGEPFVHLLFSGEPVLSASMSVHEPPYMTKSALRPYDIALEYIASHDYQPYSSEAVLIWLEEVTRLTFTPVPDHFRLDWPESGYGYPRIIATLGVPPTGPVIVEAATLGLPDLTTHSPTISVFSEDGRSFLLMTRPILPHETIEKVTSFQFGPGQPLPLDQLPFQCRP
jgi:hypothetical protein